MLTRSQQFALVTRPDLVASEAQIVSDEGINWKGRLAMLGDYGTRGGSAGDRRLIVEAFAAMERES